MPISWMLIPDYWGLIPEGAIAQLGERLLCKQEVVGSIPSGSTSGVFARSQENVFRACCRNTGNARAISDIVKR
jgi:hypothetical protein